MTTPLSPCLPALALALAAGGVLGAAEPQPRPELTEQWTPVPPIVSAPAGGVPSDAIVLFDGTHTRAWDALMPDSPGWRLENGMWIVEPKTGGMQTKQAFGDMQLHLEFRTPPEVKGQSQGRGNSGVMIMAGRYELQILDSYDNVTYANGQAASVYKQFPPLVNASRPPGEWQTYDIVFIAPRFHPDGSLQSPARITAFHNGVLVQHDTTVLGITGFRGPPRYEAHPPKLPLQLQNHGDPVAFRNIWVREITSPSAAGLTGVAGAIGWIPLFNGLDLSGWDTWLGRPGPEAEPVGLNQDPRGVFTVVEVDGRPAIRISGEIYGALSSNAPYGNYRLRLQYKWGEKKWGRADRPGNSGLLYHGHGAHGAVSANFLNSLEFQMAGGSAGDFISMGPVRATATIRGAGDRPNTYDPIGTRQLFGTDLPGGRRVLRRGGLEKPVGEWNTIELICYDTRSAHLLNGEIVLRLQEISLPAEEGPPTPLNAGRIQVQSEGAELFIRDIKLLPLHTEPPEFK